MSRFWKCVAVLREATEELLNSHLDMQVCYKKEILSKIEGLENFSFAKGSGKLNIVKSSELRAMMRLGEPREPFAEYYDGIAKL